MAPSKLAGVVATCALGAAWALDESPIKRVVTLLTEMKSQLESEAEKDGKAYDKMSCWCTTNEKEKTTAVDDADSTITELISSIESLSAQGSTLATKIEHLKKELTQKKEALKTATAIREKEHGEFNAEEKEVVQSITMLKNAIFVLGKHNAGLLQMTPQIQESIDAALKWVGMKHDEMMEIGLDLVPLHSGKASIAFIQESSTDVHASSVSLTDEKALRALRGTRASPLPKEYAMRILAEAAAGAEKQAGAFAQQPVAVKSYNSQSGQIFGVLKTLQEDFESSLSASQKAEVAAAADFAGLKAAQEADIEAGTKLLDQQEGEHADTVKALSDAKENLLLTREQRSEDVQFLSDLKLKCNDIDDEFKKRSKARNDEIKAVADTLVILTEDSARSMFNKKFGSTMAASFLQVGLKRSVEVQRSSMSMALAAAARASTSSALMKAARHLMGAALDPSVDGYLNNLAQAYRAGEEKPHQQLAAVAVAVKLDSFTKVKKAIDDLVADLKVQQEEEVAHKAECTQNFNDNEKETFATEQEHKDLVDKIAALEDTIKQLDASMETAKATIKTTEVQLKQTSEMRKDENQAFQAEVSDQKAVQAILKKAMSRLQEVYKSSFAQQDQPEANPPGGGFAPTSQNAGASPVISLIEQIIGDAAAVEKDCVEAEAEAQKTYGAFVNDSNDSIKQLNAGIEANEKEKAAAESELATTEATRQSTEDRLDGLGAVKGDLHTDCDFTLKNFDIRQGARLKEIEALQSAKASLNGMVD